MNLQKQKISNGVNNPKLQLLFATFIGLLIGMNFLGVKIISLFGISVSVGIFMIPLTFLITDIVEEVYGKETVKHFIKGGVLALIIVFSYASIFIMLLRLNSEPGSLPASFF